MVCHWRTNQKLGEQRFWYWRGWRIRYTHLSDAHLSGAHLSDAHLSGGAAPSAENISQNVPLLLLHGAGSSLEQWRASLGTIAQNRPIYALDLVGFGSSEKIAAPLNTDLWVAQVAAFWQAFLRQPMILMGHSLGASVALQAATSHPEKVARLVMLTLPAARQEVGGQVAQLGSVVEGWFASPILMRSLFYLVRQPSLIRTVLRKLHIDSSRVDADLVDGFVQPTLERGAARTFCYLVKSRTADSFCPPTQELIPLLHMPALLLWGTQDRVVPIAWGRYVNTLSDQLTFVEVEAAGHFFYDEQPHELHRLLVSWLAGELPATNDDVLI
ncbi:MAG: alpha/beta fold hydrolase [Cyanobacteria bacterium P01_D01_bin.105]